MTTKKKRKKAAKKAPKKSTKKARKAPKKSPTKARKKAAKKSTKRPAKSSSATLRKMHSDVLRTIEHVKKSDRRIIADLQRALTHADQTARTK